LKAIGIYSTFLSTCTGYKLNNIYTTKIENPDLQDFV